MKRIIPVQATRGQRVAAFVVMLFHFVGLAGFSVSPFDVLFLKIVPWHLLLMALIIMLDHQSFGSRFIGFVVMTCVLGFTAEFIGVHTGLLFGHYAYGETLGKKLWDIPLIIGVNWFLLVYSAGVLLQRSKIKSPAVRVLTGAALLVLLDILIEPIATQYDYWHWIKDGVPFKNYLCWFIVSALMLLGFELFKFKRQSIVAPVLLIMQFIFFMSLSMMN